MNQTCASVCMPDDATVHPRARHNIDCSIWDFLNLRQSFADTRRAVGRPRVLGVTPTGQRRAGRAPRARRGMLYHVGTVVTWSCVLGIVAVCAFILYHYFKV